MTKHDLIQKIIAKMNKGYSEVESFHSCQRIKGYFLDLEFEELIGIANQYGIKVLSPENKLDNPFT